MLGILSVNCTSLYETSESNVSKNIKLLVEISNNLSNNFTGTNV